MLEWFARTCPTSLRQHLLLPQAHDAKWPTGTCCPKDHEEHLREARHPEAERKFLAGVTAQYDSETVYHRNRDELAKTGVLFTDIDTAMPSIPRSCSNTSAP